MKAEEIKNAVKSGYAKVALLHVPCCGTNSSCCGSANLAEDISRKVGHGDEELKVVPEGANLWAPLRQSRGLVASPSTSPTAMPK